MRIPDALSRFTAGTVLLAASAFSAPAVALADIQDDDKEFGAYVFAAPCDEWAADAVIGDVGEVELEDDEDDIDEYWIALGANQDTPSTLYVGDEDIDDVTIEDLLARPHAVAVHTEDGHDADVIACGDVTGNADEGFLFFGLREVGESAFEGRAYIQPDDDDGGDLDIAVGVWPAGEVEPLGTPDA